MLKAQNKCKTVLIAPANCQLNKKPLTFDEWLSESM